MKDIFKLLLILSLFATAACSSKSNSDAESTGEELVEEDADFLVDSDEEELVADEAGNGLAEDGTEGEVTEIAESDVSDMPADEAVTPQLTTTGEEGTYTVQRGETLMLIAFKLYGDYTKWKDLAAMNPEYGTNLSVGTVLKYDRPATEFSWSPQGLPHLIRRGETLGTISSDKYGSTSRWRDIWNNNKPMIKNPNLIFAGFTIYYIPSEDRDVASEY